MQAVSASDAMKWAGSVLHPKAQAEVSLGSAILGELIFPTINEWDTNALIFKAINASQV